MGKRMFDAGEQAWPRAPFHTPVFVVTHEKRDPGSAGGTTFHFVNDGIEPALDLAREAPATGRSASRAAAQRSWST